MKEEKRKVSPILIVGGVIIVGLLGTFGPSMIKNFQVAQATKYQPAAVLPERLKKLESHGIRLTGDEVEYSKQEFVTHFQDVEWRKPGTSAQEDSKIAMQLVANKSDVEQVKLQAQGEGDSRLPIYKDFVHKQNSIATKRAASSLKVYISESIQAGKTDDAITGLEVLYSLQDAVVPTASEATLLYWYGVNTDLIGLVEQLSRTPGLTGEQRKRLKSVVPMSAQVPQLKDVASRIATEMIVVSRNLEKFDETEKSSMDIFTNGRKAPNMLSFKLRPAIESRLAETWLDVFENVDFTQRPEELGVAMDYKIQARQIKAKDIESDYMVAAIPLKFELFGRMIARVLQARAVLNVVLDNEIRKGTVQKEVSGFTYPIEIAENNREWVISCKGLGEFGWFNNRDGFEINQGLGVRLFSPKNQSLD